MSSIFDRLDAYPAVAIPAGEVILREAETSDRIYVLADGAVEVYRGEVSIALLSDRGAVFGEMSVLLDSPHTASVRAAVPSTVHVIDGARAFLQANPEFALPIARLLAERLQHVTSYLVDIKRQYADRSDHFQMVDEVLEALINAQPQPFNSPDAVQRDRRPPEDQTD